MNRIREYVRELMLAEAVVTGRKLNRYSTVIKRHVMRAIKDPEVRDHFSETGTVTFKLQGVPEIGEIDYLRDVIISITDGAPSISASYEFDLDATPEQRKNSDLSIHLILPRDFQNELLGFVDEELTDALSHELAHSGQETWELMSCIGSRVNADDIWSSLKNAAEYYMCPAEIVAHVTGYMKRAKRNKTHLAEVIDEELGYVYQAGIKFGYTEDELHDLMSEMREKYFAYARKTYPSVSDL